ncbi:hypothetical protein B0A55_04501 [Friedmanniomyces simplex]|uniref:Uncharacterized protein n=1 Tax=Friedmanniomyces simplex TaxID=329884 RepID=A0A4V5NHE2_9PEZI|nr:hypothetical protein B0A55_04501 [Friedmanniomyces simplex]
MAGTMVPGFLRLSPELRRAIYDDLVEDGRSVYYNRCDTNKANRGIPTTSSKLQAAVMCTRILLINRTIYGEFQSAWRSTSHWELTVYRTLSGQMATLANNAKECAILANAPTYTLAGYTGSRAGEAEPDYSVRIILCPLQAQGYRLVWQHHVMRDWINLLPDGRYEGMSSVTAEKNVYGTPVLSWDGIARAVAAFYLG